MNLMNHVQIDKKIKRLTVMTCDCQRKEKVTLWHLFDVKSELIFSSVGETKKCAPNLLF